MRLQLIKKQVTNGVTMLGDWIAYGGVKRFTPEDLFAKGEKGFWYDPSDLSTMWQDSAGTIPMATVGTVADQPVGKILDKSGNNNHATQATAGKRPLLSARVNEILTISLAPLNSSSDMTGVAVLATTPVVHAGGVNTATKTAGAVAAVYMTKSSGIAFDFPPGQIKNISALYRGVGSSIGKTITLKALQAGGLQAAVDHVLTSEFVRVTAQIIGGVSPDTYSATVLLGDGTAANFADGDTIEISDIQLENGISFTKYQFTDSTTYNASGFPNYLKFDGVDDSLATASFAMTSTSKATVFSGYANGKTASTGTQLEFSANYMNNGGGFALLVPSLSTSNVSFGSHGTLGAGEKDSPTAPAGGLEKRVLTAYQDFATTLDYGCDFIRANGIPLQNLIGVGNTNVGAGPFGTFPAYIGARAGTSNFMNGNVYGLALAGNGYDTATMVKMENWLDGKLHP